MPSTYYISTSGSDANTRYMACFIRRGLSISKINGLNLQPGDSVLFEKADRPIYGHIVIDVTNDGNDSVNVIVLPFHLMAQAKPFIEFKRQHLIGFYAYNTQSGFHCLQPDF